MKVITFMRQLVAKGMAWEDAAEMAAQFEDSLQEAVGRFTQPLIVDDAAERKRARDRERMQVKRDEERLSRDVAGDCRGDAGDETLSLPLSPQTPLTPTHTRDSNNTRARRAADFERFWADYPRKVGKGDARKAFDKAVGKIGDDAPTVLSGALERAKAAWTDAQFIPHPATWLNREGWEDQPVENTPVALEPRAHAKPDQPSAKQVARHANYERAFAGAQAAARSRNVG